MSFETELLWTPKSKSRPRVTKFGTYTDAKTKAAENNLASQWDGPLFDGPIAVYVDFYNDRIHLSVEECDDYTERKLRADTDNYLKLVNDGLNGIAWVDDRQIVRVTGVKN